MEFDVDTKLSATSKGNSMIALYWSRYNLNGLIKTFWHCLNNLVKVTAY